jgi:hypothetical protein
VTDDYYLRPDILDTPGFNGAVKAKDLDHHVPAGQVDARMNFTQGEYAREALKDLGQCDDCGRMGEQTGITNENEDKSDE